jgi:hypothetical protein
MEKRKWTKEEKLAILKKEEHYLRKLEDEIGLYRQLLAERDLELALKDHLLKKNPWARKKI